MAHVTRLRFDVFELDATTGELHKQGRPVRLPPQPARVLEVLVSNAGRLVTRDELREQVWSGGTFVDFEQGLNFCIKQIRAALGDDAKAPRYVETLPRRGYRFVAQVERPAALPAPAAGRVTLVVLPFDNLGVDAGQDFFSDGLTDEMIAQLARVNPRRLGVIARTSAMTYKHTSKSILDIARELGVTHIVEGSVRRVEGRVRVAARLIHAHDQTQLWADTYDRDLSDILKLQSELARAIAGSIQVKLAPDADRRLGRAQPVDPAAYVDYLKGRFFWNKRTKASLTQAIVHFEKSAEADPTFALAHGGVGDCYIQLGTQLWLRPDRTVALANAALARALEIDASFAETHASLGFVRTLYEYRWEDGEREFRQALALNENYASAHHWLAFHLAAVGRLDDAVAEIRLADTLDPLSPIISTNVGTVLFWARRFEPAIERYLEVIAREPSFWIAHWMLGLAYEQVRKPEQAVAAHRLAISLSDGVSPVLPASLARALALAGDRSAAEAQLRGLEHEPVVSFFHVAAAHAALGNVERAVRALHEARAQSETWTPFIKTDVRFDALRRDPQFEALVTSMRL